MASLTDIPDSILAVYPLSPPPPGVTSNFVNPATNDSTVIIFGGVMVPIMLLLFATRLYSKFFVLRKLTWDDLTCTVATIATVFLYVIIVLGMTKGYQGRHHWDVSVLQASGPWCGTTVYIETWAGTLFTPFAKCTFLIFYIQNFGPFKWLRYSCYAGIVFTFTAFMAFGIAILAFMTPHPGESWLQIEEEPRYAIPGDDLSLPISALSFGVDMFIFILPMLGIARLHLPARLRMGVTLVFMTGLAACIASFLSLYYRIQLYKNRAIDPLWESTNVQIAQLAELCIGVSASCMPSVSKVVGHHFPNFSIIDYLVSLRLVSFATWRGFDRSALSSRSPPRRRLGSEGEMTERTGGTTDASRLELGLANNTETYVDTGGNVDIEHWDGIRLDYEWEQTSQNTERGLIRQ